MRTPKQEALVSRGLCPGGLRLCLGGRPARTWCACRDSGPVSVKALGESRHVCSLDMPLVVQGEARLPGTAPHPRGSGRPPHWALTGLWGPCGSQGLPVAQWRAAMGCGPPLTGGGKWPGVGRVLDIHVPWAPETPVQQTPDSQEHPRPGPRALSCLHSVLSSTLSFDTT